MHVIHSFTYRKFEDSIFYEVTILSISLILSAALGPGVYSASNIKYYQRQMLKEFLGIRTRPVREADNTFSWLSRLWNPKLVSRSVKRIFLHVLLHLSY
jgi:hypothetical protein